jgi:NAD(P)-dependent dehydrogenase (short-subunit alcohol dehydrogenase family)
MKLKDKVAIVTGGANGIGYAIARRYVAEGARVTIADVDAEAGAAAARALGQAQFLHTDVGDAQAAEHVVAETCRAYGGLDILVNNAGQGLFKKVGDMTPEEWHLNIDLNLNGAFYCAHEALARFAARGGGFIVNISSLAARNPFSGGAAYNASKFGLNGFTEALMLDHRNDNVRVSSIMPGSVDTGFSGTPGKPRPADTSWMIAPEDVAETVSLVLRMPARTMVSRIEIRPSRPAK